MKTSYLITITIAALLIGIGILCAVVAIPSATGILSLSRAIEKEQQRVESAIGNASKLRQTTQDIEIVKKALPALERIFVKSGNEIELFALLSNKTKTHQLAEILRLGIEETTPSQIKTLPLDIELNGSFINTLRFIADLEQSEIVLPFQSLDFRIPVKAENRKTPIITTTLKGTAYVQQ